MKRIQPYQILWYSIPLIFAPLALGPNSTLDLQMHDTYYVIASGHIAILVTIFLALLGGLYWLLRKFKLIRILSLIHSMFTSIVVLSFALISSFQSKFMVRDLAHFQRLNLIGAILICTFLMVQLLFIVNALLGLSRGKDSFG